jgi:hypothetical protein
MGAESILAALIFIRCYLNSYVITTTMEKPKYSVLMLALVVTIIASAILLTANMKQVYSLAILPGENKELQVQNLPGLIKSTTLNGNKTFWHDIMKYYFAKEKDVNYIEAKFRVLGQNQTDNHAGLVFWITDSNSNRSQGYYAFLRSDRLAVYTDDRGEIQSPQEISRENGKWFTLKVVYLNNTINFFLNDRPEMQVPSLIPNGGNTSAYISMVGIQSFNSAAEFEPIQMGTVNVTKITTAIPSGSSANEITLVPAYVSLQFHM